MHNCILCIEGEGKAHYGELISLENCGEVLFLPLFEGVLNYTRQFAPKHGIVQMKQLILRVCSI